MSNHDAIELSEKKLSLDETKLHKSSGQRSFISTRTRWKFTVGSSFSIFVQNNFHNTDEKRQGISNQPVLV